MRRLVLFAFVLSTFVAAPALAQNGGAGGPVLDTPRPPAGDGSAAFDLVKDVEAQATDAKAKKLVASSLEKAKGALERAHGARKAGDPAHAHMLEGLALEWAETARDLARAAAAEQAAGSASDKARESEVRTERARALLEETQARRGRADAELEKALSAEREARERAAQTEEGRLAAAKAAASKPAPAVGKDKPAPTKGSSKPAGTPTNAPKKKGK
ncbi:MAG TPA: hypothetical protein PK156_16425 [Polyangium sp.]|nr:hypothetical protein [Polyangium sp.]